MAPMARSSASDDSARVRQIYEQRPYPASAARIQNSPRELPVAWIDAVAGPLSPRRILVAGCGTGKEALFLARRFPGAEIVAVDFSPHSIQVAGQRSARDPVAPRIRFLVADLAHRRLRATIGGDFDFVSCHGVLTYIPEPQRVLDNFRRCASAEAVLYLGVNGARHRSVRLRATLPSHFGVDLAELRDLPAARRVLRLCDIIQHHPPDDRHSHLPSVLLAGDIFGPVMHNDCLDAWVDRARAAGWSFAASLPAQYRLRALWQQAIGVEMIPRSRADACLLAESLAPSAFHRLVFTRRPSSHAPWKNHDTLLDWRPILTSFYAMRLARKPSKGLRGVTFRGPHWNTRLDWRMPAWGLQLLAESDGRRPLREILAPTPAPPRLLRQELYRLYQLMVLNLLPPNTRAR